MQALDSAGQKELAQSIYDEGVISRAVKPWKTSEDAEGRPIRVLDLHLFSAALARAAVRSYLENLLAGRRRAVVDDLVIVVGKGLRSSAAPVLGAAVSKILSEEYDIVASVVESNIGRLIVEKKDLQKLIDTRGWS